MEPASDLPSALQQPPLPMPRPDAGAMDLDQDFAELGLGLGSNGEDWYLLAGEGFGDELMGSNSSPPQAPLSGLSSTVTSSLLPPFNEDGGFPLSKDAPGFLRDEDAQLRPTEVDRSISTASGTVDGISLSSLLRWPASPALSTRALEETAAAAAVAGGSAEPLVVNPIAPAAAGLPLPLLPEAVQMEWAPAEEALSAAAPLLAPGISGGAEGDLPVPQQQQQQLLEIEEEETGGADEQTKRPQRRTTRSSSSSASGLTARGSSGGNSAGFNESSSSSGNALLFSPPVATATSSAASAGSAARKTRTTRGGTQSAVPAGTPPGRKSGQSTPESAGAFPQRRSVSSDQLFAGNQYNQLSPGAGAWAASASVSLSPRRQSAPAGRSNRRTNSTEASAAAAAAAAAASGGFGARGGSAGVQATASAGRSRRNATNSSSGNSAEMSAGYPANLGGFHSAQAAHLQSQAAARGGFNPFAAVAGRSVAPAPGTYLLGGGGGGGGSGGSGSSAGGTPPTFGMPSLGRPGAWGGTGGSEPNLAAVAAGAAAAGGGAASASSMQRSLSAAALDQDERRAKRLARNRESARQSRRRKKQYLEVLEEKVALLTEELEGLRRLHLDSADATLRQLRLQHLQVLESRVEHFERELAATRAAQGLPAAPTASNSDGSARNNSLFGTPTESTANSSANAAASAALSMGAEQQALAQGLSELMLKFGPNAAERRAVVSHQFEQLDGLLLPPFSRFLLWLVNQPESFFHEGPSSGVDDGSGSGSTWARLSRELELTREQTEKLQQCHRASALDSRGAADRAALERLLALVHDLQGGVETYMEEVHDRTLEVLAALTPAQAVRYLAWVERNRQNLSAFTAEVALSSAQVAAADLSQHDANNVTAAPSSGEQVTGSSDGNAGKRGVGMYNSNNNNSSSGSKSSAGGVRGGKSGGALNLKQEEVRETEGGRLLQLLRTPDEELSFDDVTWLVSWVQSSRQRRGASPLSAATTASVPLADVPTTTNAAAAFPAGNNSSGSSMASLARQHAGAGNDKVTRSSAAAAAAGSVSRTRRANLNGAAAATAGLTPPGSDVFAAAAAAAAAAAGMGTGGGGGNVVPL